jgi:uncharacterized protein with PIN domain
MSQLYADRMLGKLARLLRMTGQDVEYERDVELEPMLAKIAAEDRILLTRDRKLLGKSKRALYVESNYPFHQARQVLRALSLPIDRRFLRCVEDNGVLSPVSMEEAKDQLPAGIRERALQIFRCDRCRRFYWDGTHVAAMRDLIASLEGAPLLLETEDDEDPNAVVRLEPLLDLHGALEVVLLKHRVALMGAAVEEALRLFRRFAAMLHRHLADEDELVLPIYAQHAPASGWERGAAPAIFEAEHENILGHLARLEDGLVSLAATEGEARVVGCLALLDREKVFGDLLEHHDLRERRYLYPTLERILGEEEKTELLERMVGVSFKESP